MFTYWVYILASQPYGTLYIGVTNDLLGRVEADRAGAGSKFTSRYGIKLLVHYAAFGDVAHAIQRETSLKRYVRQWKINLIERKNQIGRISIPRCCLCREIALLERA